MLQSLGTSRSPKRYRVPRIVLQYTIHARATTPTEAKVDVPPMGLLALTPLKHDTLRSPRFVQRFNSATCLGTSPRTPKHGRRFIGRDGKKYNTRKEARNAR